MTMTATPTRMRRRRSSSSLLLAAVALTAASAATVRGVRGGGGGGLLRHLESSSSTTPTSYFPSSAPPVVASSSPSSIVEDDDGGDDADAAKNELELNCPPNFVGYVATPDCTGYYKCKTKNTTEQQLSQRRRRRMAKIKSCIVGLLFDSTMQICTWAEDVTCDNNSNNDQSSTSKERKRAKKQTAEQDDLPSSTKTEEDEGQVSNLQTRTKVVPYNKNEEKEKPQVIGYWRGSSSSSPQSAATSINYAKLTRINIAIFTTSSTSTITMIPENPNDSSSIGSEIDLITLLGPKVWDGSGVEYCMLSSTTCFQHDTTKVCPSDRL